MVHDVNVDYDLHFVTLSEDTVWHIFQSSGRVYCYHQDCYVTDDSAHPFRRCSRSTTTRLLVWLKSKRSSSTRWFIMLMLTMLSVTWGIEPTRTCTCAMHISSAVRGHQPKQNLDIYHHDYGLYWKSGYKIISSTVFASDWYCRRGEKSVFEAAPKAPFVEQTNHHEHFLDKRLSADRRPLWKWTCRKLLTSIYRFHCCWRSRSQVFSPGPPLHKTAPVLEMKQVRALTCRC